MTFDKINNRIKQLYNKEKEKTIVKQKGSYILFNKYKITNINGLWEVLYRDHQHSFSSFLIALSWCLLDYDKNIIQANRILVIDHQLQRRKNNILIHKEQLKHESDKNKKDILFSRISDDIYMYKSIKQEMYDLTYLTKYIKIKGFIQNAIK